MAAMMSCENTLYIYLHESASFFAVAFSLEEK